MNFKVGDKVRILDGSENVLPAGTVFYIEDVGIRVVQDTGAGCPENHIDVAVSAHSEALSWQGYGTHNVWILEEAE